jgi:hypothetical protein
MGRTGGRCRREDSGEIMHARRSTLRFGDAAEGMMVKQSAQVRRM